ncbi:RdgB/HAM1 family non-canonical purine NTP pyrophosphatase [candidate division WOR-3 bacterium]|nr:RdgB/HAM1 family non-canonical purine NTP pyrophosphatase [candidate division WOR-3 bacterium]
MKLLVATRNRNKVVEMQGPLQRAGWTIITLDRFPDFPAVEEDGRTFEDNARKKAHAAAALGVDWTLAEDAGLEIDALDGEPGVFSARYCGEQATDAERVRKVLDRMIAVPDERRTARFGCVMCLVGPDKLETLFTGTCPGRISHTARGSAGFGYDPVFIPDGYGLTFAELGLDVKHRISHRAQALREVIKHLRRQVQPQTELFSSSG